MGRKEGRSSKRKDGFRRKGGCSRMEGGGEWGGEVRTGVRGRGGNMNGGEVEDSRKMDQEEEEEEEEEEE